ncbi:MAG: hypothetical protein LBJ59_09075 [Zoogloeaceae bacterium]|nr:hypothetical protein [Zoogloeaceae bacterium]
MNPSNDPVAQRLSRIEQALNSLEKTSSKLVEVIERLTRIEERDLARGNSVEKAWLKIDDLAARVAELEKAEPLQAQTTKWVMGAVWGACGAAAMFVLKKIGVA